MAGAAGLEPANTGIKIQGLSHLTTPHPEKQVHG
jgi:hypothetical protein